ncbi:MAG: inositol monophosphatase, partial [Alphaproteobacteria bacterium]|nr:inositol monophosphatase [Alphaproteobacteria bacterium]
CAAGSLLVSEAGGRVSPLHVGEIPHTSGALIATNPHIHDAFVAMVRKQKEAA